MKIRDLIIAEADAGETDPDANNPRGQAQRNDPNADKTSDEFIKKGPAAFKKDYRVTTPSGDHFGLPTIKKVEAIAAGTIPKVAEPSSTGNQETNKSGTGPVNDDPNFQAPGYPPEMTRAVMERIITKEAKLRGMDPDVAIRIFRAEGAGSYQLGVARSGKGSCIQAVDQETTTKKLQVEI